MYYSKSSAQNISVPRNYSGNTFRVVDESERRYIKETQEEAHLQSENLSTKIEETKDEIDAKTPIINSLFNGISLEDLLLLGIIFVIHQENPNDTTLLLLLILLLAK